MTTFIKDIPICAPILNLHATTIWHFFLSQNKFNDWHNV